VTIKIKYSFFSVYLRVRLSVRQTKQDFYEHRGKLTACIIVVICEKLWHTPFYVFSTIFAGWPILLPRVRNYVYGYW